MGSVLCPLLAMTQEMSDRVGDRVRSLQDLGTLQSESVLSWRLLPTQVILPFWGEENWDQQLWVKDVNFQGHQLRLALSVEWRSGSAQELDSLLPEAYCEPTPTAFTTALGQLRQKWNATYWSQLRQSYGLVPLSIALMIQTLPKFQATGQVVRWMRKSQVCHVLETDWQDGALDAGLTPEQKQQLCQMVLEMPNLWHQDYSLTWGLDEQQQFWMVAVTVGETLLSLPKPIREARDFPFFSRASSEASASGIAQVFPHPDSRSEVSTITDRTIVVVRELLPAAVSGFRSAKAIIVEAPGWNSHGVILAREFGIPVIVGVERATEMIRNGEALILRGLDRPQSLPSPTRPRRTGLLVNRSQLSYPPTLDLNDDPSDSYSDLYRDSAQVAWTENLGLVRSEWLLLPEFSLDQPNFDSGEFKQLLRSRLTRLLNALTDRDDAAVLYYRCLNTIEDRETAASLELTIWQELQHQAWIESRSFPPTRLILPYVQTLEQFIRWRQDLVALNLASTLQSWIMAEVPSVVQMLPDYIEAGAMGVIIGLNDLTQGTLAVSRESALFQAAMKKPDRAVIRSVQSIIQTTQQANLPCWLALSTWSEAWAEIAIEAGITGLMVERDTVRLAALAIDRIEAAQQGNLD